MISQKEVDDLSVGVKAGLCTLLCGDPTPSTLTNCGLFAERSKASSTYEHCLCRLCVDGLKERRYSSSLVYTQLRGVGDGLRARLLQLHVSLLLCSRLQLALDKGSTE